MAALLTLMATLNGVPAEEHEVYIRTMEVVEIENDLITGVDAEGFEWQFYGDGFSENELVSCIMDTMGTENDIFDDAVLDVYSTGFQRE